MGKGGTHRHRDKRVHICMYVCKNVIKNCKNIHHSIKSKFQHTLNSTFDEKNVWTNSHRFPFTVGNDKGNAYNSVNVHELRV